MVARSLQAPSNSFFVKKKNLLWLAGKLIALCILFIEVIEVNHGSAFLPAQAAF